MKAIFDKELKSYFTGITGWLFMAVMLLSAGIYTMIYNLSYQYACFEYVFASSSFIYLILIPILTMRSFPEERKQKTDQLLYSLPLKMTDIVLGKFFAAAVVLLIPVIIMSAYPFVISIFSGIEVFNFKIIYSTMLIFYLIGLALIAVCMFVSSLTENQILAAIFSFVVVLLAYFSENLTQYASSSSLISTVIIVLAIVLVSVIVLILTGNAQLAEIFAIVLSIALVAILIIKSSLIEGVASTVLEKIALFNPLYTVIYGQFNISDVIYMLSVIILFNFFGVQVLEKRRWA